MNKNDSPSYYRAYASDDEDIVCPINYKDGSSGHGLLKKYYIPSLNITMCDYCEVDDEKKNDYKTLSYFQQKKDCKHLIKDFGELSDQLHKIQNITRNSTDDSLETCLISGRPLSDNVDKNTKLFIQESVKFNDMLYKDLLPFLVQIEDLKKVKEIINKIKFDKNGKVDLAEIGNRPEVEKRLIWLALFLMDLKGKDKNSDQFIFSDYLIPIAKDMVRNLYNTCLSSFELFKYFCNTLLPEINRFEQGNNFKITYEELMKDFKLSSSDDKVRELTILLANEKEKIGLLERRINELEIINQDNVKFKELYFIELEKNQSLNNNFEKLSRKTDDVNNNNEFLKNKINELELLLARSNQEKQDMKNNQDKVFREKEIEISEKIRNYEKLLKDRDASLKNLKDEYEKTYGSDKKLKERIYELEMQMLKDKESMKILETDYDRLLSQHNQLKTNFDHYVVFANETRQIALA